MCARYEISRVEKLIFNPRTEKTTDYPLVRRPKRRHIQHFTVGKNRVQKSFFFF